MTTPPNTLCLECGRPFVQPEYQRRRYCSRACFLTRLQRADQQQRHQHLAWALEHGVTLGVQAQDAR
jgi:hypothetical protein